MNPAKPASSGSLCATRPAPWYDAAMVTLIPIEPLSDAHAFLIVEAFSKLFINGGGKEDGCGDGWDNGIIYGGDGDGDGYGYNGDGYGDGTIDDCDKIPEEWRVGP